MNKIIDKEFDIESAVDYMQKYWGTYKKQYGWKNYSREMFLNDAIFGLGVSLDPIKYRNADGFEKFKIFLYRRFESIVKKAFILKLKRK